MIYPMDSPIPWGGGETPHMKWVGVLVGNFELNPYIEETDPGIVQAFSDPLKRPC